MLIIQVKDDETIDKALSRYKKKHRDVGIIKQLRKRQAFEKKSVTRRNQILSASYRQVKFNTEL